MPALLHPPLMVGRLSIGLFAGLLLIVIHFVVSLAAGLFGFRRDPGGSRNTAGLFGTPLHRLSAIAQALLIVGAGHLVPAGAGDRGQCRAHRRGSGTAVTLLPPFWFLGAQETLAGGFVDRLPRQDLPRGWGSIEERATPSYRAAVPAISGAGGAGADGIRRVRSAWRCRPTRGTAGGCRSQPSPPAPIATRGRAWWRGWSCAPLARAPADPRRLLFHRAVPAAKRAAPSGAGRVHCRVAGAGDRHL